MTTQSGNQMTDSDVRKRLDHLGFTDEDSRLLQSLRPWAETAIPAFAKEFYDRQFKNPEFAAIIRSNESNQQTLEGAQGGYAMDLFGGWPNAAYIEKRVRIGGLHARIGITPEWYIASYQFYFDILYPMIRRQFLEEQGRGEEAVSAVNKLLVFDQAVIMDTYVTGITDRLKGLITQVASTAENLAAVKSSPSNVLPHSLQLTTPSAGGRNSRYLNS